MPVNTGMVHKSLEKTGRLRPSIGRGEGPDLTHNDHLRAVAEKQDRDSFIQLFQHFAPRIKSYLIKSGSSPDQADELAQETMLTLWNKAADFDPNRANASTWIFTIARNKRIDAIRKTIAKRETTLPELFTSIEDNAPGPGEQLSDMETTQIIANAMEHLPDEQAELIRKSFFEGKSHSDIAAETGIALGTVKSRIRTALERLRADIPKGDTR